MSEKLKEHLCCHCDYIVGESLDHKRLSLFFVSLFFFCLFVFSNSQHSRNTSCGSTRKEMINWWVSIYNWWANFFSNRRRKFKLRSRWVRWGRGGMRKPGYFFKVRVRSPASTGILLCAVLLLIFKHWSQDWNPGFFGCLHFKRFCLC